VTDLRRGREPIRELPEENTDLFEERPLQPEEENRPEDTEPRPQSLPEPEFGAEPGKLQRPADLPVFGNGIQAFEALFRQLRGKFGREELIIVLVMLLVSSEGASMELMLLALILIAG